MKVGFSRIIVGFLVLCDQLELSRARQRRNVREGIQKKQIRNHNRSFSISRGGAEQVPRNPLPFFRVKNGGDMKTNVEKEKAKPKLNFPIALDELRQFSLMSLMMFLFIYFYTTVRDTKDTLVVSNCGAEAIPFLKMYGVMPIAMGFIIVYSKLSQFLGKKALFYITLLPFFAFYALFAFVLFPNRDLIHFTNGHGWLNSSNHAALNLIRYWSYSLYFIVSELWASAGIPLLFWQVANDITTVSQAKRFYPLFAITGNLAPIVSGGVMSYIVSRQPSSDDAGFEFTLKKLAGIKLFVGAAIIILYNLIYIEARRSTGKDCAEDSNVESKTKAISSPRKPTLRESIIALSKSSQIKSMAVMVLSYNICVELTEVLWKGILRKTYPNKADYMAFMASFSQKVGVIALCMQISASTIIGNLGWTKASLLTPVAMVSLALPFFISVSVSNRRPDAISLATVLAIGTCQNVVNKVTKYSLFDPLKEMAYIPMGPEAKIKGKAAIDVLGARLGRSVAAGSQQIFVMGAGNNILNCAPYLATVYAGTISMWVVAVNVLGKMFNSSETKKSGKAKCT